MADTHLLYDDPMHLYQIAVRMNKNLMCHVGSQLTDICVLFPEDGSACPIMKLSNNPWTAFEQTLVDEYLENAGIAAGDSQPLPNYIEECRFLPIQCISLTMNPEEMTDILNEVSRNHKSHGFVFGYSCAAAHWDDTAQYKHIDKMLTGLISIRRLSLRLFTFVDEFGSTETAVSRLNSSLPQFVDIKLKKKREYIDCYSAVVLVEILLKDQSMLDKPHYMSKYVVTTLRFTEIQNK